MHTYVKLTVLYFSTLALLAKSEQVTVPDTSLLVSTSIDTTPTALQKKSVLLSTFTNNKKILLYPVPSFSVDYGQLGGIACFDELYSLRTSALGSQFVSKGLSQGGHWYVPPGRLGGTIHKFIVLHPAIIYKLGPGNKNTRPHSNFTPWKFLVFTSIECMYTH